MMKPYRNPYADAFSRYNYPNQRIHPMHPNMHHPDDYDASQDLNGITKTLVSGAVVIGAMGLLGNMFRQ